MFRIVLVIASVFFITPLFSQLISAQHLTCENFISPMGVDVPDPVFGWKISTSARGLTQSAYQIWVSDDPKEMNTEAGNYWNSGKVASDQSVNVVYKGKKLLPGHVYYWRVQVWDQRDYTAERSGVAHFSTGLFTTQDWSDARWIGYEDLEDSMRVVPGVHNPDKKKMKPGTAVKRPVIPLFRKEFVAGKAITRATAYISGLGQYEMTVNNQKVGESFLAPGWTWYDKRYLYNTYDITNLLIKGNNAVGVIVGNGFFNINRERYFKLAIAFGMPKLLCKIQVEYADGTQDVIVSGSDWKTAPSPVTYTSIYGGEDYDARLEQQGWDSPGFNDAQWKNALLVKAPLGKAEAEKDYPVQINHDIDVRTILKPKPGIRVYDFGQNAAGIVTLKVKGKKGQSVKLTPAELLGDDQLANQRNTGKAYYLTYTLKGGEEETWTPRFTYYGFRYVQVEVAADTTNGQTDLPEVIGMEMHQTGNSAPAAGTFECSSPLFNNIHTLIQWAIRSNVQSVVTDCPHREKLSWLEQDYLVGGSIKNNIDVHHLYRKLVYDMMDAQTNEGFVPDITPEYVYFDDHGFGFRDSPEWGSASVMLPWLVYKWYGDIEMINTAYPMMKKYVAYLKSRSVNQILDYGLGDWYDLGPQHPGVAQLTPKALTATAIYYYDLALLSKMAAVTGNSKDAALYRQQAKEVKAAFNKKFFNPATKVYATGSQTSMAMPLSVGLVEEVNRKAVFKNLTDSIIAGNKQLTAGDIGFHFLVQALHEGGASQLLYEMNNRDDVPGYGYQLKKGATALTESWQALKEVSNNHLMLGHLTEWLYGGMAGIGQTDSSVGFSQLTIRPEIVGDITHAKATFESIYGVIGSEWTKTDAAHLTMTIQVPGNTTALIYIPSTPASTITEMNSPLALAKGITIIGFKEGRTIVQVGSGNYLFKVKD